MGIFTKWHMWWCKPSKMTLLHQIYKTTRWKAPKFCIHFTQNREKNKEWENAYNSTEISLTEISPYFSTVNTHVCFSNYLLALMHRSRYQNKTFSKCYRDRFLPALWPITNCNVTIGMVPHCLELLLYGLSQIWGKTSQKRKTILGACFASYSCDCDASRLVYFNLLPTSKQTNQYPFVPLSVHLLSYSCPSILSRSTRKLNKRIKNWTKRCTYHGFVDVDWPPWIPVLDSGHHAA